MQVSRRVAVCLWALGSVAWSGALMLASDRQPPARAAAPAAAVTLSSALQTYCASCHTGSLRSASGLVLEKFDAQRISSSPELWAKAYRQLQAGAMPPVGSPRPDRATSDGMLTAIERAWTSDAKASLASSDEIATRLASMLWNSAPDAALLQDARRNSLATPQELERQVQRMLADDRSRAFVSRFFIPWLQLDTLAKADPDTRYFPDYDVSLRDALLEETELFLLSQLRDDRDPIELWSADYTFLNEQLAKHYGVADVRGPAFRRVTWSSPPRAGLLGHGSVLMATSRHEHGVDAAYTTPATRAKWVRMHYFGAPLPNGFPGAQPVRPELPITPQTRTLPAEPCVNCHRNFFPIGYALENFDPIGRWRTHDQVGPVDVTGSFVDGTPTNGVVALRQVMLGRPEAFRTTVLEQLVMFSATGAVDAKGGTPESLARARQILRATRTPRWSNLIASLVRQQP